VLMALTCGHYGSYLQPVGEKANLIQHVTYGGNIYTKFPNLWAAMCNLHIASSLFRPGGLIHSKSPSEGREK